MLVLLFSALVLAMGVVIQHAGNGRDAPTTLSLASLLHILVAGLLGISLLAVVLLEAQAFGITALLLCGYAVALTGALASRWRPTVVGRVHAGGPHLALALILLLALFLRLPPSNWVAGGQDPGVYVNVANYIRQHGTVFIHDGILRSGDDQSGARAYYVQHSYLHTALVKNSCDEGVYTPGIYVQDLKNGILVPQFYHLHPLWLAMSGSLFGPERSALPLTLFALLSIVLTYRLTILLTHERFAALSAALLLAVNPLHSYMAKFPVTEVPAGFFFLAGLYFLIRLLVRQGADRFNGVMAVLAFACLFFTRIVGFLHLVALFGLLAYALIFPLRRAQRVALTWCCVGIAAAYAYSVLHGHFLSCAYSEEIYLAFFNTDFSSWQARGALALLIVALLATYLAIHRYRRPLLRIGVRLAPYGNQIALLLLVCVLAVIAQRAGAFLFNESSYDSDLRSIGVDPASSSKLFGIDLAAAAMLNVTVLNLLLTPVAFLLGLYGVYLLLRRWPDRPAAFACGYFALYFLAVNTTLLVESRYLYYYARYLLSETVPLLIIAAGVALGHLHARRPRAALAALAIAALPCLGFSYMHTRDSEMKDLYPDLERVAASVDRDSVVLIDRDIVPDWRRLAAPLALSFDVKLFWFDRADLEQGRLDDILRVLGAESPTMFAIANEPPLTTDYFAPARTLPVRLNAILDKLFSVPVGFVVERDTVVTVYRGTDRLRALVHQASPGPEPSAPTARRLNIVPASPYSARLAAEF